jgi:ADP-heptose:LPS heptosyltransferase
VVTQNIKILLLRFSSFGDVTQCLSVPSRLQELDADAEIHWATRDDMASLISGHPRVKKIWTLKREDGFAGLWRLIRQLRREGFTHIYDAHNSTRSRLICWFLSPPLALERVFNAPLILHKPKKSLKRLLLFRFRKNFFEMPFSGQRDLLEPLQKWGLSKKLPPAPQIFPSREITEKIHRRLHEAHLQPGQFICLAASAAHLLKRWPLAHWQELIRLNPERKFVCLGGKEDHFLKDLVAVAPERVLNWAGELSLMESAAVIAASAVLVSNDTGVLHLGEQLGHKTIALMGPAPFGFPSRESTKIMQLDLSCRPCSKHGQGPCYNEKFQRCLVEITPRQVQKELQKFMPSSPEAVL